MSLDNVIDCHTHRREERKHWVICFNWINHTTRVSQFEHCILRKKFAVLSEYKITRYWNQYGVLWVSFSIQVFFKFIIGLFWIRLRRGPTQVSTVLRKSVTFFIIKNTFQVEISPISCLNDSETQKRGLWGVPKISWGARQNIFHSSSLSFTTVVNAFLGNPFAFFSPWCLRS